MFAHFTFQKRTNHFMLTCVHFRGPGLRSEIVSLCFVPSDSFDNKNRQLLRLHRFYFQSQRGCFIFIQIHGILSLLYALEYVFKSQQIDGRKKDIWTIFVINFIVCDKQYSQHVISHFFYNDFGTNRVIFYRCVN